MNGVVALKGSTVTRPEELSTRTMRWRDGTEEDESLGAERSGTTSCNRGMLDRGLL